MGPGASGHHYGIEQPVIALLLMTAGSFQLLSQIIKVDCLVTNSTSKFTYHTLLSSRHAPQLELSLPGQVLQQFSYSL